jgi:hypothetical protein
MKWLKATALVLACALFLYLWSPRSPYRYNLAVCAMFKNEAPWLKEWIVYHHDVLGFEHFYLYNNDSSDNYQEVLKPFIDKGIVEVIEWKSCEEHKIANFYDARMIDWAMYQVGAYNECIKKRALGQAKWVAMIDIDEFIVPVHGKRSFYANLRSAEKRNKGSFRIAWRMFGTSNVWDLKPGELMTERLIYRAADDDMGHNCGKSMHRPEAVEFCHVHDPGKFTDEGFQAGKLKGKFRFRHPDPEDIRIHHYWTRTEKACREKRGNPSKLTEAYNHQVDRSIEPYLPALKEAMARY